MKRSLFSLLGALFLACGLAGCATTTELNLDYNPATDFSGYKTYAWVPPSGAGPNLSVSQNDLIEARVKTYVDKILAEKGFREAPPYAADFLITYHNIYTEKQSVRTIGEYAYAPGFYWHTTCRGGKLRRSHGGWAQPYYVVPRTYVEYYTEGTFVLDIIDRQTQKLVWRGSAVSILYDTSSEALDQKMQEAAFQLLGKFPPPPPPPSGAVHAPPPRNEPIEVQAVKQPAEK